MVNKYTLTLVFNQDKTKVLMVFHNKQQMYNFVGGHIEKGESELNASYRELQEETGITANDIELTHLQTELSLSNYDEYCWSLYITMGVLKHNVKLIKEKNRLEWVSIDDDNILLNASFGNGNCRVFMERALKILNKENKDVLSRI